MGNRSLVCGSLNAIEVVACLHSAHNSGCFIGNDGDGLRLRSAVGGACLCRDAEVVVGHVGVHCRCCKPVVAVVVANHGTTFNCGTFVDYYCACSSRNHLFIGKINALSGRYCHRIVECEIVDVARLVTRYVVAPEHIFVGIDCYAARFELGTYDE